MICKKCGATIKEGEKFCSKCGASIEQKEENSSLEQEEKKAIKINKKIWIVGGIILALILIIAIIVGVIFLVSKPKRAKTLMNLDQNPYLKFTLNEEDFYLGETASSYQQKGYTFEDDFFQEDDKISRDSIIVHPIYHEEEDQFLGALYCAKENDCTYQDSILVKANFYENSDVIVNDFIKIGLKYKDIVEKYGKEEGKFYQGNNSYVWTFGEKGKIGEPYYILTFNNATLSDTVKLVDIRIGVWWYDGEYEHTVIE